MSLLVLFFFWFFGLLCGVAGCAAVAYFYYKMFLRMSAPVTFGESAYREATPSEGTKAFLRQHPRPLPQQNDTTPTEQLQTLNFIADFLFIHLRDTAHIKHIVLSILDRNFEYLLTKTSLRHICRRLKVKSIDMGTQMPHIKNVRTARPSSSDLGMGYELELLADMSYEGKCNIVVEADLIFTKKGTLLITLAKLCGRMRFSLHSSPHLHWTMGFLENADPPLETDFDVEFLVGQSDFKMITNLVKKQILRAFKRVMVIQPHNPNSTKKQELKKRYAPFFKRPLTLEQFPSKLMCRGDLLYNGVLKVEVIGCRHLKHIRDYPIYATLSLFSEEIEDKEYKHNERDDRTQKLKVNLIKAGSGGSIGISLDDGNAIIHAIKPGSPASGVDLRVGDKILAVDDIPALKTKKVLQLIKKSGVEFSLDIHRRHEKKNQTSFTPKNIKHKYAQTGLSLASKTSHVNFNIDCSFKVTSSTPTLYVRVYDVKKKKKKEKSQRFMIGYGEVDLETVAMSCVANNSRLAMRLKLYSSDITGATESGYMKLILTFIPKCGKIQEGLLPFLRRSARPRASSVAVDSKPVVNDNVIADMALNGFDVVKMDEVENLTQGEDNGDDEGEDEMLDEYEDDDELNNFALDDEGDKDLREEEGDDDDEDSNDDEDVKKVPIRKPSKSKNNGDNMFADLEVHARKKKLWQWMSSLEKKIELEEDTRRSLEAELEEEGISQAKNERLVRNLDESDKRSDELHCDAFKCMSEIITCDQLIEKMAEMEE
eukprot:m.62391 g.62391  ORF g.62391 m.62391 type:complete len:767 (-) comp11402_c0_seq35:3310-5610(-)